MANRCKYCGEEFVAGEEEIQTVIDSYEGETTREEAINIIEFCDECAGIGE
jgi:hypothetical protein